MLKNTFNIIKNLLIITKYLLHTSFTNMILKYFREMNGEIEKYVIKLKISEKGDKTDDKLL